MKDTILYTLPKDLIAQYPLIDREKARLLVVNRKTEKLEERCFSDITGYFEKGDVLVLNNSKVIPARLKGRKITGGLVEIFLLKKIGPYRWEVLLRGNIKASQLCRIEKKNNEDASLMVEIEKKNENGSYIARFDTDEDEKIFRFGEVPLPPYIKRKADKDDEEYYQTVYAKRQGSVAAHTAGLHFTTRILEEIASTGVQIVYLTLHIGWSSFKILKENEKSVGEEFFEISDKTASVINTAKQQGRKIFAAGTSSVRALESAVNNRCLTAASRRTELFIKTGFNFSIVDAMLTNFHLPGSTHLYLVCGFAGADIIEKAYKVAVEKKYRFYSYGDAMLII